MKLLNYTIEASLRSRQPITHFKVHRYRTYKHLVWWNLSVLYGQTQQCEECETETGLETLCEACNEYYYCECGTRLSDEMGSPGDGLCRACD
jgi:hypothetical protein